jgi:transposase-like protein
MPVKLHSEAAEKPLHVCAEPGCLIRYNSSDGYFIATEDAKTIEQEMVPRVSCPNDEHPMYLAEVRPEKRSFRLWKCPKCNASRTNEESSPGLGKKMGA